jgi:hypothetical protein
MNDCKGVSRQAPPFLIIIRIIARPPRRPCADAERSVPSNEANTFAAARPTPKTMAPAEASQPGQVHVARQVVVRLADQAAIVDGNQVTDL